MHAQAHTAKHSDQAPVSMVFLSPDRALAQRVITRLRELGRVTWQPSCSPGDFNHRGESGIVLVDFSPARLDSATQWVRELALVSPQTIVLAVGCSRTDGSAGILAAMRADVTDFIDLDAPNTHEVRLAIERARQQSHHKAATHVVPSPQQHGKTVLLLGVRPGMGTSTLVAHLGVLAQQQLDQARAETHQPESQVVMLDMGHPGGDLGLYLDTQGDFHIGDAIDNAYRLDNTLARTALAHHKSNAAVLPRAVNAEVPTDASGHLDLLLDRLDGLFHLVLIDGGGTPSEELSAALINQVNHIWLVADQSLGTMVSMDDMLKTLHHCGADASKLALVINRQVDDSGLTPQQIAERFKLPLLATLPERGARLRASANTGKLLQEVSPRDRYLQALKPLLARLAPDTTPAGKPGTSWFRRVRHHLGV